MRFAPRFAIRACQSFIWINGTVWCQSTASLRNTQRDFTIHTAPNTMHGRSVLSGIPGREIHRMAGKKACDLVGTLDPNHEESLVVGMTRMHLLNHHLLSLKCIMNWNKQLLHLPVPSASNGSTTQFQIHPGLLRSFCWTSELSSCHGSILGTCKLML